MDDLSVLYYTANRISEFFARNVRDHLEQLLAGAVPIVSVSQKPINFGRNLCVGMIGASTYNTYRQILDAAEVAETKYVACCEDDCLYVPEHFQYRPPLDTFAYNVNRWTAGPQRFFHRKRAGMCMCIAPRKLLVRTLKQRFAKYPEPLDREGATGWGEPGRLEHKLGLPPVKLLVFETETPTLCFNHRPSVGGVRRQMPRDDVQETLEPWGNATELWTAIHG